MRALTLLIALATWVIALMSSNGWAVSLEAAPSVALIRTPIQMTLRITNLRAYERGIVLGNSRCGYRFELVNVDTNATRESQACRELSNVTSRGARLKANGTLTVVFPFDAIFRGCSAGRYLLRLRGFVEAGAGFESVNSNAVALTLT